MSIRVPRRRTRKRGTHSTAPTRFQTSRRARRHALLLRILPGLDGLEPPTNRILDQGDGLDINTVTVTAGTPTRYAAPVTPGAKYSVAIIGLSDSAASLTTYPDGCFGTAATTAATGRSPQESIVTPDSATLWIAVGADPNATSPTVYVLLIAPVPAAMNPQSESQSITEDVPAVGQVATRSISSYAAAGLASGARYAISVTALTDDAVLHVYSDGTYSLELDCTLRLNHIMFAPQECQLAAGAVVYFSVASGPINLVGARYEILVTRL